MGPQLQALACELTSLLGVLAGRALPWLRLAAAAAWRPAAIAAASTTPTLPSAFPTPCSQTDSPELEELFSGAGLADGFSDVFLQAWPTVREALDDFVVGAPAGMPSPSVWVAGYSMGSAVAALAALASQEYLNKAMGDKVSLACK